MSRKKAHQLILIGFLAFSASPAFAYIDPGTGTMLVQAILAFFASVLFYFDKVRAFLRKLLKKIFSGTK